MNLQETLARKLNGSPTIAAAVLVETVGLLIDNHREMCGRLQECLQRMGLPRGGGERADVRVVQQIERLRQELALLQEGSSSVWETNQKALTDAGIPWPALDSESHETFTSARIRILVAQRDAAIDACRFVKEFFAKLEQVDDSLPRADSASVHAKLDAVLNEAPEKAKVSA